MNEEQMRKEFEADAERYGFNLTRSGWPTSEPWSEYISIETGHRWGGWLAACEIKQKEIDAFNRTKLYSLDSIECAIFNHDSDGCDRPETDGKYQQRRKEWTSIKLFLLDRIDTFAEVPNRAAIGKTTIEEKPPVEPEEVYSPHAVVVDDKCRKCAGQMRNGKAIAQTLIGIPDFAGGAVVTMSPGGSGKLIDCMKCSDCGWSVGK